jgi:hypothetical protein
MKSLIFLVPANLQVAMLVFVEPTVAVAYRSASDWRRADAACCRLWVNNGPNNAEARLPKCRREQTFAVLVGMSQTCQKPTWGACFRVRGWAIMR